MAVYAVGDLQGCYSDLLRLLDKIKFDQHKDRLWFAGDLVNRGPDSLSTLRLVKGLGKAAITVLGNHDLHLLAISEGNLKHLGRDNSLQSILRAQDREELLLWLRHRPLMHCDKKLNYSIIHAGLAPQWSIATARSLAREVEVCLQGDGFSDYCMRIYGNKPDLWDDTLSGMARLRFITNCFTRLRYCDPSGVLALRDKGPIGSQSAGKMPWFSVPGRASRDERIIFGHWSTLGYHHAENTWALDSGCLWGGHLSALQLRKRKPPRLIQVACGQHRIAHRSS
ncbi:MAG: symmetrical bis(5'-nucleosyl)-tetraphosphatase [Gammaproteobacteria bacterium]|nr:symmetrical bis(5'-nucleosyl)-tetraphosphatase [Gammaproteobacteria bacterium]